MKTKAPDIMENELAIKPELEFDAENDAPPQIEHEPEEIAACRDKVYKLKGDNGPMRFLVTGATFMWPVGTHDKPIDPRTSGHWSLHVNVFRFAGLNANGDEVPDMRGPNGLRMRMNYTNGKYQPSGREYVAEEFFARMEMDLKGCADVPLMLGAQ